MDRRRFLIKGGAFLAGNLFGLSAISRALAWAEEPENPLFPPRIALIIDDIGFSLSRARQFLDLGVPITYSILPRLGRTRDLAREIHSEGHEVMLHQPMEPFDTGIDPGPGALFVGDEAPRIMEVMEENISEVPFATGVNNHMGSKFTSCRREIQEALKVVRDRGLFFVDSLTTNRSMAYRTARSLNMEAARRNIFLDTHPDESSILGQLFRLKMHALKYGRGIGIGHPFPETARAIGRFIRWLPDSGISLVHVSDLVLSA